MSPLVPGAAERAPRRARHLIPPGTPRRREALAALALAGFLAGLLLAQVTLALAVVLHAIGRITRWHPRWLAVPAAAGAIWALAVGPAAAAASFVAVDRDVAAVVARALTDHAAAAGAAPASGGVGQWLAGQLPLALVAAAALAAWAQWLRWLHTDEWDLAPPRPGPVVAGRRHVTAALVRSGAVLTRDGACLGADQATGRPAAVSWQEARRGVLVAGADHGAVSGSGFQFAHAAIRRRQPVIVVDPGDGGDLTASVTEACRAVGAPLQVFGAAGTGCYEPWRSGDPAGRAALVMGAIDWDQAPATARPACQAWLTGVFAVLSAAPGDPGMAVLEEVTALLVPGALIARAEAVPSYHPRRRELAERAAVAAARLDADQAAATFVAGQLRELRSSPLGRWLGPVPGPASPGGAISLGQVVRQRGVAVFSLEREAHGRVADLIATVVALDVAAVYAGLLRAGGPCDGLAWFSRCESVVPEALAGLIAAGADGGLAPVLTTTSPAAAGRTGPQVNVLVLHRLGDPALAAGLSWLTGARSRPVGLTPGLQARARRGGRGRGSAFAAGAGFAAAGGAGAPVPVPGPVPGPPAAAGPQTRPGHAAYPVVAGEALCGLGPEEFTLVVRAGAGGAVGRVVPRARAVRGRVPGPRGTPRMPLFASPAPDGAAGGAAPGGAAPRDAAPGHPGRRR